MVRVENWQLYSRYTLYHNRKSMISLLKKHKWKPPGSLALTSLFVFRNCCLLFLDRFGIYTESSCIQANEAASCSVVNGHGIEILNTHLVCAYAETPVTSNSCICPCTILVNTLWNTNIHSYLSCIIAEYHSTAAI